MPHRKLQFEITYKINYSPPSITCLVCNKTSYNSNDIAYLYCGFCHAFHNIKKNAKGHVIPDTAKPPGYSIPNRD